MMGIRRDKEYVWTSCAEVARKAKLLAAGMEKLDLVPEVEAEGGSWRFLGLKSANRPEWGLLHTANYHYNVTSVALYDTLGADATAYIID